MRLAAIAVWLAMIWPAAAFAVAAPPPTAPVLGGYSPREGDFNIAFPNPPKASFRLVTGGRERSYLDNEGDQLFMVIVANVFLGGGTDDGAYARRLQRFAAGADVNLTSSRHLRWSGEPAFEGVFTNGRGVVIVVRMLMHDKRLYQAVYQGQTNEENALQSRRFFDSFKLIDPVKRKGLL